VSENYVEVPFEDDPGEQATMLLAAAEDLGMGQEVVQTRSGAFYVPEEVRDKASGSGTEQKQDAEQDEKPRRGTRRTRKAQE